MPPWLASHLICELYHAIIFYYVLNLSIFLVHSITLPVHQPFGTVMEKKSEVETRSSEETMLSNEAHVLLVTDSSLEEDLEIDDQSYPARSRCML